VADFAAQWRIGEGFKVMAERLYWTQEISLSPERQQKVLRSLELQMDRKHKPKTDSLNRVWTEMFDDRP
jgi:hypothetical protein